MRRRFPPDNRKKETMFTFKKVWPLYLLALIIGMGMAI